MLALAIISLVFIVLCFVLLLGFAGAAYFFLLKLEKIQRKGLNSIAQVVEASGKMANEQYAQALALLKRRRTPVTENDIEKRSQEEIPLEESMRIPVVSGMKVRYEDENESYPIDLLKYGEEIDKEA